MPGWIVTYSGGQWSSSGPFGTMSGDYGGTYGGGAVTGGPGLFPGTIAMAGPGSAKAEGEITATLTWDDGNDFIVIPPPTAIVIREYCAVSWSGTGGGCTNPLGHAVVPDPMGYGASSSGAKYWIKKNPPASFDIHISPKANASFASGTGAPLMAGSCSVNYNVSASELGIALAGGAGPNDLKRYLIGQNMTGSLISSLTPDPATFDWSVSGAEPFDKYDVGPNVDASSPTGDYANLDTSFPLDQSTVSCHFKVQGNATVDLSVHLKVTEPGALPTAGLDADLTRSVTVVRPDSIQLGVQIGWVEAFWDTPAETGYVQLRRLPAPIGSGNTSGMRYDGLISYNTADFGAGGQWGIVQLISASDQRKSGTTWQKLHQYYVAPTKVNIYGVQCLDNSYPYAGWPSADGAWHGQSDSPGEPMENVPIMAKDLTDSFVDTMMFRPPGGQPVPVKNWTWYWEFHATRTGTLWNPLTGTNAQWGFGGDFPAFPSWDKRLVNSWLLYQ